MAETAEAVARLSLNAEGFDRQAAKSLESFTKQLRSVQDATDVVISGAEQLQKRFVKSLGGVAVIGLANALGDAMRDVGAKIGSTAQAAADATSGFKGLAGSFEEGAARAEKMSSAASAVAKSLEELNNFSSLKGLSFKALGGEKTLQDLQSSLQGASAAEQYGGALAGLKRQRDTAGMTPDQIKAYDLQQAREKQLAQARALGGDFGTKTESALKETFRLQDEAAAKAAADAQAKSDEAARLAQEKADAAIKAKQDRQAADEAEVEAAKEAARKAGYTSLQDRAAAAVRYRQQMRDQQMTALNQLQDNYLSQSRTAQAMSAAEGLASSRFGAQMLNVAEKRQAERNRIDNYKFNQEQVQAYADRMATRGSGQSLEEFERYSKMTPDAQRLAAQKDLANQKARRDNPSDRASAQSVQEKIKDLLEKNLEELKKFTHAS